MQLRLASAQKQEENNKPETKGIKSITPTRQSPHSVVHSPAPHPWQKDFKIAGQIGEPGQKDKPTFSSLARQIEHGLSKGFPELEIVDAVIRAISPGMQLRSYLEGKTNLTLPTLRRILRCHYQEKSATDLYEQLTSEVQGIKETPQNFLIRTFDLRQKYFVNKDLLPSIQFSPAMLLLKRMKTHQLNKSLKFPQLFFPSLRK